MLSISLEDKFILINLYLKLQVETGGKYYEKETKITEEIEK